MPSFGLDPFGGPSLGPATLGEAASRLEGVGAYPRFPEDVAERIHAMKLGAIGAIASVGASTLDRACAQAFVDLATQLLDAWERIHRLSNDSARQLADRWARLVAKETFRDVDVDSLIAALARVVTYDAAIAATDWFTVSNLTDTYGLEPWAQFQYVVSIGAAFDDTVKRRAVELLLRQMPTYRLGQMQAMTADRVVVDDATAPGLWNSAASRMDRSPIARNTSTDGDGLEARKAPSRVRSYGPLSRIDSRDINAIQDAVSAGAGSAWTGGTKPAAGYLERWFSIELTAAADLFIDQSVDWRQRMIRCSLIIDAADIRPVGATELNANLLTVTERLDVAGFWTTGGVAQAIVGASGVEVYSSGAPGKLRIRNTSGGTLRVIGMIGASEPLA